MRYVLVIVILLSVLNPAATARQQSPTPRFEVASIKLWGPPVTPVTGVLVQAPARSGVFNRSTTVAGLITYAYDVEDFQLSGGENWVRTERYDVSARAGREASQAELREMVKALLADRLKLRVRTETRDMPILELRLARSDGRVGPNLHDCSNPNDKEGISTPEKPFRAPLQIPGVDLSREEVNPNLPSFEGALREQLGLRLERTRGPAPVIVIDSVERPTPN